MMDKVKANLMMDEIEEAMKLIAKKYGMDVANPRGSYTATKIEFKMKFYENMSIMPDGVNATENTLKIGYAMPGTQVTVSSLPGQFTILEKKRTRYVIRNNDTKKMYRAPFDLVRLVK